MKEVAGLLFYDLEAAILKGGLNVGFLGGRFRA